MRSAPRSADSIAALRADIAELKALVEHALSIMPPREWLTVDEAAALVRFTPQCIRGWCRANRIGVLVRNEWQVDRRQLRAHVVARFGLARLPPELRDG
jgi:hypothetical protein